MSNPFPYTDIRQLCPVILLLRTPEDPVPHSLRRRMDNLFPSEMLPYRDSPCLQTTVLHPTRPHTQASFPHMSLEKGPCPCQCLYHLQVAPTHLRPVTFLTRCQDRWAPVPVILSTWEVTQRPSWLLREQPPP